MYARIARFTGVDADVIDKNVAGIRERVESGPPEGVPAVGFRFCADKENGTVVAIGFYETEEDMRKGDATPERDVTAAGRDGHPQLGRPVQRRDLGRQLRAAPS